MAYDFFFLAGAFLAALFFLVEAFLVAAFLVAALAGLSEAAAFLAPRRAVFLFASTLSRHGLPAGPTLE